MTALAFGLYLLGVSPSPILAQAENLRQEILKINYLFNRELYELAIPQYEKFLEAHPDFEDAADVHHAIAMASYQLALRQGSGSKTAATVKDGATEPPEIGPAPKDAPPPRSQTQAHLKSAVAHLDKALAAKGFKAAREAASLLGQCHLLLGNKDEAVQAFSRALVGAATAGSRGAALLGLADAHYLKDDFRAASDAYRKVLALEGDEAQGSKERAAFYLAMSLYRLGSEEARAESLGLFDQAAKRPESPYRDEARYMAALVCEVRGDIPGAIKRYGEIRDGKGAAAQAGQAPAGGPYAELAALGLGRAQFAAGKKSEAAAVLRAFIAAYPDSSYLEEATLVLARSLGEDVRSAEAVRLLQELRTSKRVGDTASLELARILQQNGKADAAARLLRHALDSFPQSARKGDLELELARSLLAAGDGKAAGEILSGFDERHEEARLREAAASLRPYALFREKKHEEAIAAARSFLEAFPGSADAAGIRELEAECLFLGGRYREAAAAYETLAGGPEAANDPKRSLKARFRIAQAAYLQGEFQRARELLSGLQAGADASGPGAEEGYLLTLAYLTGESAYQLRDYKSAAVELGRFIAKAAAVKSEAEAKSIAAQLGDARFKRAHALQLSGDVEAARTAYKEALQADPAGAHAEEMRFELGQIAYGLNDREGAKEAYAGFLKENPDSAFAPQALRQLGWLAFAGGDYPAAVDHYKAICERHPKHELATEASYQLGAALMAAGREEQALAQFRRFAQEHPTDERARLVHLQEAAALSRLGKTEEALEILAKLETESSAAALRPSILYEKAWCHRARNEPEEAVRAYRALLALPAAPAADSGGAEARAGGASVAATARVELAELEFERGDFEGTLALLTKDGVTLADAALRERGLYRVTWCRHKLEDERGTVAAYDSFQREFPQSKSLPELAYLAASAKMRLGEHAAAAELFRRVADSELGGREAELAQLGLAECLAEEQQFEEARKRFQTFLKSHPESSLVPRARIGVGWAEENLGNLDAAIAEYRQAAAGVPTATAARAQFQIGQCLASQKKYREAVVELLHVVARYKYAEWTAKALLQTANCFEALNDVENARKHYREVIASHPDREEAALARERLKDLDTR